MTIMTSTIEKINVVVTIMTVIATCISFVYIFLTKRIENNNRENTEHVIYELKRVTDINKETPQKDPCPNDTKSSSLNNKTNNKINTLEYDYILETLIQNYHTQALKQSTIQFWFSLIAAIIGLIFIIISIFFGKDSVWYNSIINIIPGVIVEAVSVLFFSQSKETRERSSDFLNRLREDRQYEKGIAIAETISDEEMKSLLKAEIALRLCGIEDINIFEKDSIGGTQKNPNDI